MATLWNGYPADWQLPQRLWNTTCCATLSNTVHGNTEKHKQHCETLSNTVHSNTEKHCEHQQDSKSRRHKTFQPQQVTQRLSQTQLKQRLSHTQQLKQKLSQTQQLRQRLLPNSISCDELLCQTQQFAQRLEQTQQLKQRLSQTQYFVTNCWTNILHRGWAKLNPKSRTEIHVVLQMEY